MASSSGTSSVSTKFTQSSVSEEEDLLLLKLMEQRKNKRKQSNRDSARRSRMRRQKHLDDLIAQVEHLKNQNSLILTNVNITTQQYLNVEAQNSILRASKTELSQSLKSFNHIIDLINFTTTTTATGVYQTPAYHNHNNNYYNNNSFMNPMHMAYLKQPIVATADNMFQW